MKSMNARVLAGSFFAGGPTATTSCVGSHRIDTLEVAAQTGAVRLLACVIVVFTGACDGPVLTPGSDGGDSAVSLDAGAADAGAADAATDGGSDSGPPAPLGPVLYPDGARHSPIPPELAAGLRAVADRGAGLGDDLFIKVGDSITVSTSFLHCFAGSRVDLDGRDVLQPTLDTFLAGDAGGTTPFDRTSLAAGVGWSASAALAGSPSPLDQEHAAVGPRFAIVMYGTNDVGFRGNETFARDIWTITDTMIDRGTIPLLSTIPPRDDSASADARVPIYNLAIRAIAQGRGVPLVDYHLELVPLPSHGLAGDGVHPQAFGGGSCVLTAAGLAYGANVRNLITLEQLDRTRSALSGSAPDAVAPHLEGSGASDDPYVVQTLPFAAMGDTASSPHRTLDGYACGTQGEAGAERVYRVEVSAPGTISAAVLSATGVDADVYLIEGAVDPAACLARDDQLVTASVSAGTYYVVADTYSTAAGAELPGEYLVVISIE